MLVRGSFGVFTGVMNKSQLRPEIAENDQVKLLSKIRELLDAFEGGKKAGLISDQKKPGQTTSGTSSGRLEGIDGAEGQTEVEDGPELRKQKILRQMEEDKMSIRASYEARITAELDEICSMFDAKTRQEIEELKSELILNVQRRPEAKEELFAKFKKQSRDIEITNQKAKEAAITRAMEKYRVELKADIEKLKLNAKNDLEAGNISQEDVDSYFADDELDEYLKKLLEEQQRRYLASKGYMSDDSAIDQDEWERIFREQVAIHFRKTNPSMSDDDLDRAIDEKVAEAKNQLDQMTRTAYQIEVLSSGDEVETGLADFIIKEVGYDLARNEILGQLRNDYESSLDPNMDSATRDQMMKEFDKNRKLAEAKAAERRRLQQEALQKRLQLRKKMESSGLSQSQIDQAINKFDEQLAKDLEMVNATDAIVEMETFDLELEFGEITLDSKEEKRLAANIAKAERDAKKEANKSNLSPEEAAALMAQMKVAEAEKVKAEAERKKRQKALLAAQLAKRKRKMAENEAELIALQETEALKIKEEEEKRLQMLEAEKLQFSAALASGELDPNQVYKILGKRHAGETAELKRKLEADKQLKIKQKENEIIRQREEERSKLTNDNDALQMFDKETERMIQTINETLIEAVQNDISLDLEMMTLINDLNEQQMKEIEEALMAFNPEAAARIQFELEMKAKKQLEEDSRKAKAAVMNDDMEKEKQARLKKLAELEAEQKRIDEETQKEIEEIKRKDEEKQKQRKAISEKRAEAEAQKKLKNAKDEDESKAILEELGRQKTQIDADLLRRKKAQNDRLKDRIRAKRENAQKEKTKLDEEIQEVRKEVPEAQLYQAHTMTSNPLKLVPSSFQYDSSDPLALLTELPVFKELKDLEESLRARQEEHQRVLGAIDSNFIDLKDAQYRNEGKLQILKDLEEHHKTIFNFGTSLVNHLCARLDLEPVKILVATSLPQPTEMASNAFRHSYFYDSSVRTVFIRQNRFDSGPGDLALVLCHFVAHLRSGSFENDGDVSFLTFFFKVIKIIAEITFRNTNKSSARMKADQDLINARTILPSRAVYPRQMITPNVRLDQNPEDRLKLQPSDFLQPSTELSSTTSAIEHKDESWKQERISELIELESKANIQLTNLSHVPKAKRTPELTDRIKSQKEYILEIQNQLQHLSNTNV